MIVADWVDGHELWQIIFIWRVVAVPSDYVERWMIRFRYEKCSLEFRNDFMFCKG